MRLLLADDHVLFTEALIAFIQAKCPTWRVIAASSLGNALDTLANDPLGFDLVMLDIRMPGMNGLNGLRKLLSLYPDQSTAIISGSVEEHQIRKALNIGARAYFPKTLSGQTLTKAIDLVVSSGHRFVPTDGTGLGIMPSYYDDSHPTPLKNHSEKNVKKPLSKTGPLTHLTNREKDVLDHLSHGLSNKDIADKLGMKPTTVKIHVSRICKKLNAENRTQAAIIAHQYDLATSYTQIEKSTS